MRRMNRWRAPRWIRFWMIAATRMGDGWIWYGLGLMLFAMEARSVFRPSVPRALPRFSYFCIQSAKETEPAATALQIERIAGQSVAPDKFSFPSGHTMTAFSVALVVSYFYPSLEGVLFFLALSIAVSRIVLGMHF